MPLKLSIHRSTKPICDENRLPLRAHAILNEIQAEQQHHADECQHGGDDLIARQRREEHAHRNESGAGRTNTTPKLKSGR